VGASARLFAAACLLACAHPRGKAGALLPRFLKASQHRFRKKKGSHRSGARDLPGRAKTGQNPRVKKKKAWSFAMPLEGAEGLTLARTFLPSTRPRETNEHTFFQTRAARHSTLFVWGIPLGTGAGSVRGGFRGCGETSFFLLCACCFFFFSNSYLFSLSKGFVCRGAGFTVCFSVGGLLWQKRVCRGWLRGGG
jgi:hypothetical protein